MDAAITPTELRRGSRHFRRRRSSTCAGNRRSKRIPKLIPGAIRRPPEALDTWAAPLEPWRPVVVYCVRGHEVSQNAAAALRARGLEARHPVGRSRALARRRPSDEAVRGGHALGHARAAEDRPHRLPVAHPPLHRSRRGILLRAERRRARVRRRERRDGLRHPGRRLLARRARVQLRCVHPPARARPPRARRARENRSRGRHVDARPLASRRPASSRRRSGCRRCSPTTTRC